MNGLSRELEWRVVYLGVLLLMLSACGGLPRGDRPASVEERTEAPPSAQQEEGSDVQIAAYTPRPSPATRDRNPNERSRR